MSMKHIKNILVYVIMIALIIVGALFLDHKQVMTRAEESKFQPTAYIEADESSAAFKMAGRISEILVKEGDLVTEGQLLARMESAELEAKVAQAEAAVKAAEGQLQQALGALSAAEAKQGQSVGAVSLTQESVDQQIAQAEAAVKAAEAQLKALQNGAREQEIKMAESQLFAAKEALSTAQENLARMKSLLELELVSQIDVDQANMAYIEAKAKYEAAEQQYELAKEGARAEEIEAAQAQLEGAKAALALAKASRSQVSIKRGDVAAAEGAVQQALGAVEAAKSVKAQAEAALQEVQTYLGYTSLYAPADGRILSISAQEGELVNTGYSFITLERTDAPKWAKFYVPETELGNITVNSWIEMKLISTGETVYGTVVSAIPAATFATTKPTHLLGDTDVRSFGVKVEFDPLPDHVISGMTVQWIGLTPPSGADSEAGDSGAN